MTGSITKQSDNAAPWSTYSRSRDPAQGRLRAALFPALARCRSLTPRQAQVGTPATLLPKFTPEDAPLIVANTVHAPPDGRIIGDMIYWLENQRLVRVEDERPCGKVMITYLATGDRVVISKRLLSSPAKELPGCECRACAAVRELTASSGAEESPLIVDTGSKAAHTFPAG